MFPEKTRMGSNYVYVTPTKSTTYTYHDAVEICAINHNAVIPTIHSAEEASSIGIHQILELSGIPYLYAKGMCTWLLP